MNITYLVCYLGLFFFVVLAARFSVRYSAGVINAPLIAILILTGFLISIIWMASAPLVASFFQPPPPVYDPYSFVQLINPIQ